MSDKSYESGAFTVSQRVINEGDSGTWIELELKVSSGPVRVPVRGGHVRQAELKAEALCLASISAELQQANETENE
ncbi:MAG TPA: hypothetical protein VGB55_00060 [Tepidisphaeraceae bacterium]